MSGKLTPHVACCAFLISRKKGGQVSAFHFEPDGSVPLKSCAHRYHHETEPDREAVLLTQDNPSTAYCVVSSITFGSSRTPASRTVA